MRRGDLTNGQWARLEPLLPTGIKPGRPQVWTRRQLIDGIRWRTRTGAPWRDGRLPVNVSGGLQSKGHPIAATGIANIWEICQHLRGEGGDLLGGEVVLVDDL